MKIPGYVILAFVFAGVFSVGTAYAVTFNENVMVTRTGSGAAITVQADGAPAIKLNELDTGQIFQIRLTGDGSRMDVIDITNNRVGISMSTSTGNIGIGINTATEQLDVNGNARVRGDLIMDGDITSSTDLCLGTCP